MRLPYFFTGRVNNIKQQNVFAVEVTRILYDPDNIKPAIYPFDYKYKLYEDYSTCFYNYITGTNEKIQLLSQKKKAEQKKANADLDSVIQHYTH